jgi:hypothetical protein
MSKKGSAQYFCVAVRRDYESVWRFVSKHNTQAEAEEELERRRSFKGTFNYDNAELRVLSRAQAKAEFGQDWEYKPIGGAVPKQPTRDTADV